MNAEKKRRVWCGGVTDVGIFFDFVLGDGVVGKTNPFRWSDKGRLKGGCSQD